MVDEGELLAGRYRLVTQVGTGAMGVVWKARDEHLSRVVAVKHLLHVGMSDVETEEANRRAMREARITARLHHPHAIVVYDVVEHDGKPCLIMEYLHSKSLSTVLAERGPLPPAEVARIGSQIAAALAAAHEAGIVHRDIKPGNVLLAADGTAKITDFGISRAVGDCVVTATGILIGTPAYLAPEVARGEQAGFPADVFSLGSTLYAAVEGTPPFGVDDNPLALLFRIVNNKIIPPTKSGPHIPVLSWLLNRDLSRRPTMQQARDALATAATALTAPSTLMAPSTHAAASILVAASGAVTAAVSPLAASGASATASLPSSSDAPTAKVALRGDAPALWPPAEGVRRPRSSAAVIAVAAASVLVAGLLLVATLINDGNNTAGPAAGPPSTTPGTAQNEQVPQRPPAAGDAAEAAPIRAPIPVPAAVPGSEPNRVPSAEPSPEFGPVPSPEPGPVPSSEPDAVPSSEPSPVPTPEPSQEPRPEFGPVPTPEPSPAPEADPEPSSPSDAANP